MAICEATETLQTEQFMEQKVMKNSVKHKNVGINFWIGREWHGMRSFTMTLLRFHGIPMVKRTS